LDLVIPHGTAVLMSIVNSGAIRRATLGCTRRSVEICLGPVFEDALVRVAQSTAAATRWASRPLSFRTRA
jgi:hypothetical protein